MAGPLGRDREAVQLPRQSDGEVAHVDELLHLALAFGADLAGLDRHELAELRLVLAYQRAEHAHELAAAWRRNPPPLLERAMRNSDDAFRVLPRGKPRCGEVLARDRRVRRKLAAGTVLARDAERIEQRARAARQHARNRCDDVHDPAPACMRKLITPSMRWSVTI